MNGRHVLIFCSLCLVATFAIGFTARSTNPLIERQRRRQLQASAIELVGEQATTLRWQRLTAAAELRGYAALTDGGWLVEMAGPGYGGTIRMLAHFDHQGKFLDMRVFDQRETPGFGTRIARSWYGEVFINENRPGIPQRLSELAPDTVDVVSGATVSFRAVARLLQQASDSIVQRSHRGDSRAS